MSVAIRRAIYGKLSGDTTLNGLLGSAPDGYTKSIYHQVAPQGAKPPYVVFNKQAGTPRYALSALAYDNEVWLVKAVDSADTSDTADNIASRLDALLTDGSVSISGKTKLYLRRESDVEYAEQDGDTTYHHSGANFRLIYE